MSHLIKIKKKMHIFTPSLLSLFGEKRERPKRKDSCIMVVGWFCGRSWQTGSLESPLNELSSICFLMLALHATSHCLWMAYSQLLQDAK
jgi:hypothetical protein